MSVESESTSFQASPVLRQDLLALAVDEGSIDEYRIDHADTASPSSGFLRRSERNPEIKYVERGDVKKLLQRIKR